jgi:hypothetical protein
MLIFPQLSTLASAQYPIVKRTSRRAVQSSMEDGTIISLSDSSAFYTQWKLALRDLSDKEASSLIAFFAATNGSLSPFLFLDPSANLLSWSSDLTQTSWQTAGLALEPSLSDPLGGTSAFQAVNTTSGNLSVAQPTQIPGSSQTSFSVYLRAGAPVTITIRRSAGTASLATQIAVTTNWTRYSLSSPFPAVTDASTFALTIPPQGSLSIFGPQVDAQLVPSTYIPTSAASGVFPNARFDMDTLAITATGPNRNACELLIRVNGA